MAITPTQETGAPAQAVVEIDGAKDTAQQVTTLTEGAGSGNVTPSNPDPQVQPVGDINSTQTVTSASTPLAGTVQESVQVNPNLRAPPGPTRQTVDKPSTRNHKDPLNNTRGVRKDSVKSPPESKGSKKKPGKDALATNDPQEDKTGAPMELDYSPATEIQDAIAGTESSGPDTTDRKDVIGQVVAGVSGLSLEDTSEKDEVLFREFLESEAIAHSEYAEVGKLLGRRTPELVPRSCMKSMEDFGKWLAYLGFSLSSKDHWLMLGLNRSDCRGHAGVIKNRMAQAQRVFEYGRSMKNIKITTAEWEVTIGKLVEASIKCIQEVDSPSLPADDDVPLAPCFGELSAEGIQTLREWTGHTTRIFTQCSDLIAGYALAPGTEDKDGARKMAESLRSVSGISTADLGEAAFWAPSGRELHNLLSNFWQGSCNATSPWVMHLIFPLPGHLGGLSVRDIKDLWKNPVLSSTWDGLLRDFVVTFKPIRMVCPTKHAPTTSWKHMGIATLAVAEISSIPTAPKVERNLAVMEKGLFFLRTAQGKIWERSDAALRGL